MPCTKLLTHFAWGVHRNNGPGSLKKIPWQINAGYLLSNIAQREGWCECKSDIEWILTAGLRILTYEKKSCFKIEKLSVSLTANNIANSNYWTFSCLFKLFTLKKTHTSHFFPILLNIFWGIIENMGQIGALFSHSHCLKRLHVLINLPLLTWTSRVNSNQNRFSKQQSSNALWIIFVFHHNYIFVRLLFHTARHSAF